MVLKEQQGDFEAAEFIRKLSLVAIQHINLKGFYEFSKAQRAVNLEEMMNLLNRILNKHLKR